MNKITNAIIPINQLAPHPRNYNTHGDAQIGDLRLSLRKFGQVRSIVVQATAPSPMGEGARSGGEGHFLIVAGHGLCAAARLEKYTSLRADVIPAGWDEARVLAYLAADNELARQGTPDEAQLAAIVAELHAANEAELARLAAGNEARLKELLAANAEAMGGGGGGGDSNEIDVDRAEEARKKYGVESGQLWRVGDHRIICGDCTDIEIVMRLMQDDQPAIIIADPPYGVNIVAANVYVGGGEACSIPFGGVKNRPLRGTDGAAKPFGSKKVRGSDRAAHIVGVGKYSPIEGDETTDLAIKSSAFYLKKYPDATQVWWGANYYADVLEPSPCWVVWDKETTGYFADCELAWVNVDKAAKLFRHRWNGMLRNSERERRWHPTQKPAALAAYVFTEFGAEGDIILDPFAGAGWAVLGAERTNRKARAIEKSAAYVGAIIERMSMAFPGIVIERIE